MFLCLVSPSHSLLGPIPQPQRTHSLSEDTVRLSSLYAFHSVHEKKKKKIGSGFCVPREHLALCQRRRRKKYVSICALYEHCVEKKKNEAEKKKNTVVCIPTIGAHSAERDSAVGDSIHHTSLRQTWLSWASSSLFI